LRAWLLHELSGEKAMNAERLQQVEQLFHAALEREASRRADFLREACGVDEALRHEVETLLSCARKAEDVFESTATDPAAPAWDDVQPHPAAPASIDHYRILGLLGEGGMGAVYEAEQEYPRRIVAFKVIKPGLANPELMRRFEQESQALARLQHPGIAQIYEAGTANTGFGPQPWFAMECIRGQPLRDYAEAHQLNTRQRLELMVKICDAVHHAHQRGLIHRDLKPGNILVDNTGQPKILDFGIARVTDSDTRATQQTEPGQLMGTLAYMSPEQVLGDPLELDTRSDIYALGVIVYELLTGRLPHNLIGNPLEVMRIIREENPQPLSSVNRLYRGDIETIVSKALEKDKTRRYASAADLGADIQRYLKDEPIIARPPSAAYQLQKLARRHKAVAAGVAAVFVVLIAGIIASTREATRARRAEQVATAVDDFLQNDLLAQASASVQARPDTKPDPDLKVRTALDRAAARIAGKFKEQPLVEAAIRQTIGNTYRDLGLFPEAQRQLERALDLRRRVLGAKNLDTLAAMQDVALLYVEQGKYGQAEPLYTNVLEARRRELGEEHPDTLETTEKVVFLHIHQGRYAQAEPLCKKVLELRRRALGEEDPYTLSDMNHLAMIYLFQGKYAQAEPLFTKTLELQRRVLGEENPDTLSSRGYLAHSYMSQGKYAQAEPLLSNNLAVVRRVLGEDHPDTIANMNDLAQVYIRQGKFAEAEPLSTKVLEGWRRVLGEEHPDTLVGMDNLALLYRSEGKYALAEPLLIKVQDLFRRVRGEEHRDTLISTNNLALVYLEQGRYAQAEPLLTKVLEVFRRTEGEEHPDVLGAMSNLALLYRNEGKYELAEPLYLKALELQRRVLGPAYPRRLAVVNDLALLYVNQGRYAQAEALLHEALNSYQKSGNETWDRYNCQSLLGASLAGQKKYEEAEPLSVSGYEGMLQRETTIPAGSRFKLAHAGEWIVQLYKNWGKPEKAAVWKQKLQATGVSVHPPLPSNQHRSNAY
jgi:tetratricopeptide (TPR) repeat protein